MHTIADRITYELLVDVFCVWAEGDQVWNEEHPYKSAFERPLLQLYGSSWL